MTQDLAGSGASLRALDGVGWLKLFSSLLVLGGAALVFVAIVVDYYGFEIVRSFGRSQAIALTAGLACMLVGVTAQVKLGVRFPQRLA